MATVTFEVDTPSSSNTSSYASGAFTVAVGDVIIVFVEASGTVAAGTMTDSLGQVTFSKVTSSVKNASADTLYLFIANGFATSTGSRTVTFDCTGDNATGADIQVYSITGLSKAGSAAVRQTQVQNNQTNLATAPAPAFTNSCLTGNVTLGAIGNATNPATLTNPTNWTEGADSGYTVPTTGLESVFRNSGFTGTTITWGSASASNWSSVIVEIDASSLSGAGEDDTPPRLKNDPYEPRISVWQ